MDSYFIQTIIQVIIYFLFQIISVFVLGYFPFGRVFCYIISVMQVTPYLTNYTVYTWQKNTLYRLKIVADCL